MLSSFSDTALCFGKKQNKDKQKQKETTNEQKLNKQNKSIVGKW